MLEALSWNCQTTGHGAALQHGYWASSPLCVSRYIHQAPAIHQAPSQVLSHTFSCLILITSKAMPIYCSYRQ